MLNIEQTLSWLICVGVAPAPFTKPRSLYKCNFLIFTRGKPQPLRFASSVSFVVSKKTIKIQRGNCKHIWKKKKRREREGRKKKNRCFSPLLLAEPYKSGSAAAGRDAVPGSGLRDTQRSQGLEWHPRPSTAPHPRAWSSLPALAAPNPIPSLTPRSLSFYVFI